MYKLENQPIEQFNNDLTKSRKKLFNVGCAC